MYEQKQLIIPLKVLKVLKEMVKLKQVSHFRLQKKVIIRKMAFP